MTTTAVRFSGREARRFYTRLLRVLDAEVSLSSLGLTVTAALATWPDQSGNNNDATEATNKPSVIEQDLNWRPGVEFNGTNQKLDLGSTVTSTGPFSLVTLCSPDDLSTDRPVGGDGTDSVAITSTGAVELTVGTETLLLSPTSTIAATDTVLLEVYRDDNDEPTAVVNGDLVTSREVAAAIADDGAVYTDETTEANDATAGDLTLLPPVPVATDAYLVGMSYPFRRLNLVVDTAGVGAYTVTWKYWNGAWTNLSGVTDGTSGFKSTGGGEVSWTVPGDWATTTINSQGPFYYIRAEVDAGGVTTVPTGSSIAARIYVTGDFDVSGVGYDGASAFWDGPLYHWQMIDRALTSIESARLRRAIAQTYQLTFEV
jgi:hypothetical protein